jgi:hypothetical protein
MPTIGPVVRPTPQALDELAGTANLPRRYAAVYAILPADEFAQRIPYAATPGYFLTVRLRIPRPLDFK